MRMKRLLTGVLSAALLGATPLALTATSAEAKTTVATVITGKINKKKAEKGATVWISGNVDTVTGGMASPVGKLVIRRKLAGQSSYKTVYTDERPGSFFYKFKAKRSARYQIQYLGGSSKNYTYTPSSANVKSKVTRKLKVNTRIGSLVVKGKVKPKFKKKKFVVQVKSGKWKKWKKVKTNKKSRYRVKLRGNRKGIKYRFVVPASKGFVKTVSPVITARRY